MRKRMILIATILGAVVGLTIAGVDALTTSTEPYKAQPAEVPEKATQADLQRLADENYAGIQTYVEKSGLVPVAGYQNERGETTGYLLKTQLQERDKGRTMFDVVTVRGTKVGEWDGMSNDRPSVAEVNAKAEEESR